MAEKAGLKEVMEFFSTPEHPCTSKEILELKRSENGKEHLEELKIGVGEIINK